MGKSAPINAERFGRKSPEKKNGYATLGIPFACVGTLLANLGVEGESFRISAQDVPA